MKIDGKKFSAPQKVETSKPQASQNISKPAEKKPTVNFNTSRWEGSSPPQVRSSQPLTTSKLQQQQTQGPVYPDSVTAALGQTPSDYMAGLTPPANITAQGADAVNNWKMGQLAQELHTQLYDDNGAYRRPPPFNDAEALQTLYSAAAQLSYEQIRAEGKDPNGDGRDAWEDRFMGYAHQAVLSQNFGDYGWNPIYQDGSATQGHHFQLALGGSNAVNSSFVGTTFGTFISQLGNYQHEYQGSGPSKQDGFNSMFAIMVSRDLQNRAIDPFQAAVVIGTGLQTGEPIVSMNFADPRNYLWAAPVLGLPDAAVNRERYP